MHGSAEVLERSDPIPPAAKHVEFDCGDSYLNQFLRSRMRWILPGVSETFLCFSPKCRGIVGYCNQLRLAGRDRGDVRYKIRGTIHRLFCH